MSKETILAGMDVFGTVMEGFVEHWPEDAKKDVLDFSQFVVELLDPTRESK